MSSRRASDMAIESPPHISMHPRVAHSHTELCTVGFHVQYVRFVVCQYASITAKARMAAEHTDALGLCRGESGHVRQVFSPLQHVASCYPQTSLTSSISIRSEQYPTRSFIDPPAQRQLCNHLAPGSSVSPEVDCQVSGTACARGVRFDWESAVVWHLGRQHRRASVA